jgi:uncharacterized protein YcbK (DUF882 family)
MASGGLRIGRRAFAAGLAAGLAWPAVGVGAGVGERTLAFSHLHTGEALALSYWRDGAYLTDALAAIDRVLRDHRTGEVKAIDRRLLDLVWTLRQRMGSAEPFEVISGYRSPATNEALRKRSGGVAKRSLHMKGMAIDVRLPGSALGELRQAAIALRGGGVGNYPEANFIHVDIGRVRQW